MRTKKLQSDAIRPQVLELALQIQRDIAIAQETIDRIKGKLDSLEKRILEEKSHGSNSN